jgi:hypothetical protein
MTHTLLQNNLATCFVRFIPSRSINRLIVLSRYSAVPRLLPGGPTNRISISDGSKIEGSRQGLRSRQATNSCWMVAVSSGVKRPGCEAGTSPTSSAHVITEYSCRLPPRRPQYAFIKCTGTFTFSEWIYNGQELCSLLGMSWMCARKYGRRFSGLDVTALSDGHEYEPMARTVLPPPSPSTSVIRS